VLVFAKNFFARERLKEQFMIHSVERIYIAVIEGAIEPPEGTIESDLFEQRDLKMVSVDFHSDAKHAVTHYRTIGTKGAYPILSMLEVTLETGRKNQIRAHLSEAGHPVAGDKMYGATTNPLGRLGLHAKLLGFDHPTTGKHLVFTAALPKAFRDVLR
jgi:23S rRNA pseudouridine1911/1915/1917 synthase